MIKRNFKMKNLSTTKHLKPRVMSKAVHKQGSA